MFITTHSCANLLKLMAFMEGVKNYPIAAINIKGEGSNIGPKK